jgi:ribulose-phosphate 3-epimerase
MAQIVPTITAYDEPAYASQIREITPFTQRVHLDVMDGEFAPTKSVSLDSLWWPHSFETVDIHMMYQRPFDHLKQLVHLRPHMVIVHVETMFHHMHFAAELHKEGIKAGLAIMPDTPVENIDQIMSSFDHILLFSGDLGHFGGTADVSILSKIPQIREHHPHIEIGWDGGINAQNAKQLADAGVDVLNVGGSIHNANQPTQAYEMLMKAIAQ